MTGPWTWAAETVSASLDKAMPDLAPAERRLLAGDLATAAVLLSQTAARLTEYETPANVVRLAERRARR